ncbi:protein kinase-like domain-containing protein [Artemisia annua]|uniref:Protein kinase-like domain-containing protein n=1 Tax=Artemisia annua TaxID=35608 RepID=A0A2U1LVB8_ARTAN|nr:protein kinase-like domain-containing protein [Artemisia annua]
MFLVPVKYYCGICFCIWHIGPFRYYFHQLTTKDGFAVYLACRGILLFHQDTIKVNFRTTKMKEQCKNGSLCFSLVMISVLLVACALACIAIRRCIVKVKDWLPEVNEVPSSCSMLSHLIYFLVLIILVSTIHLVNGLDSEAETLIEFKDYLLNGEKLTTWIAKESPCNNNTANWEGILCTNGTIWGIKLDGKGLQGNINTNILAGLSSLVSISFNDNYMEGGFPNFGVLKGIREISLSKNNFFGEIPANAFKGLKWLEKLDLANNELIGQIPASLTRLPKLKVLMLQDNQFEGEIPKFDQSKLTSANFANNHFRGRIPQGLQQFPARLFSGNELCGAPLGECQRIRISPAAIVIIALVLATAVASLLFAIVILSRHHHQEFPAGVLHNGSMVLTASSNLRTQEKGGTAAFNGNKEKISFKLTFLTDVEEEFDLPDLLKAAAEILGSGRFGSSYKAALTGGKVIVVKRFKEMNNVSKEEFYRHIKKLGRLRHPNIQPIVAFYYRKDEKLLVSDFVDNISLSLQLHGNQSNGEMRSPDWPTRLKIVKGVVKGLQIMYSKLPSLIVPHGHLKSSNVLLTKNYVPLLTDYGLVPVTNPEQARDVMMAYKSPEYKQLGRITKKTDIWCLGVLILEIMTGKIPANILHQSKGNDTALTDFIDYMANQEFNIDIFDKQMTGFDKSSEGEMMKLWKIGLSCCEKDANKRMDIKQVVEIIEELKEKDGATEDDFQSTYSSELDKRSSKGLSDDFTS